MKVITYSKYGSPEVLEMHTIDQPVVQDLTEQEFLKDYDISEFDRPNVTVDIFAHYFRK